MLPFTNCSLYNFSFDDSFSLAPHVKATETQLCNQLIVKIWQNHGPINIQYSGIPHLRNHFLKMSLNLFLRYMKNETFPVSVLPVSYKFYKYYTVYKKVKFI